MEIISNCTQDDIKKAAKALKDGHLVAFPTETVYGLGADATNEQAVGRIYSVKGRPSDHPLIVHVSSIHQLDKWAVKIPEFAMKLATQFWPGPLTLILKRSELAKNFITGDQDSVGVRAPNHTIASSILKEFELLGGFGVVAPSANRFGAVSPTSAPAVNQELGGKLIRGDLILDGGPSAVGVESTILDCTSTLPRILRPGVITRLMIEECLGLPLSTVQNRISPKFSGSHKSHYAPKARVLLNSLPSLGDGLIALSEIETPKGVIRLASPKNSIEYAQCLYEALRDGDNKNLSRIIAILPEGYGIEVAIKDRLIKASSESD